MHLHTISSLHATLHAGTCTLKESAPPPQPHAFVQPLPPAQGIIFNRCTNMKVFPPSDTQVSNLLSLVVMLCPALVRGIRFSDLPGLRELVIGPGLYPYMHRLPPSLDPWSPAQQPAPS